MNATRARKRRLPALTRTEIAARDRLGELDIDLPSTTAVSNIFRAANAARNYLERTVLRDYELSFSGFTVLWVLWIEGPQETRLLAVEAGITKGTLTGVLKTLEGLELVRRTTPDEDRRLTIVKLTARGKRRMRQVFPKFNQAEAQITAGLNNREWAGLVTGLRSVLAQIQSLEDDST